MIIPSSDSSHLASAGWKRLIIFTVPSEHIDMKAFPLESFTLALALSVMPHLKKSSEYFHVPIMNWAEIGSPIPRSSSGDMTAPPEPGIAPEKSGKRLKTSTCRFSNTNPPRRIWDESLYQNYPKTVQILLTTAINLVGKAIMGPNGVLGRLISNEREMTEGQNSILLGKFYRIFLWLCSSLKFRQSPRITCNIPESFENPLCDHRNLLHFYLSRRLDCISGQN